METQTAARRASGRSLEAPSVDTVDISAIVTEWLSIKNLNNRRAQDCIQSIKVVGYTGLGELLHPAPLHNIRKRYKRIPAANRAATSI
jgi:hypothetical protein